jgi:hypothetical protein
MRGVDAPKLAVKPSLVDGEPAKPLLASAKNTHGDGILLDRLRVPSVNAVEADASQNLTTTRSWTGQPRCGARRQQPSRYAARKRPVICAARDAVARIGNLLPPMNAVNVTPLGAVEVEPG